MAFRLGFFGRWGAWIVLLVSLLTTVVTWYIVRDETTKRAHVRFEFQVKAIETGILERFKAYELLLLGGVGLFEASDEVTREDWHLYVKTLRIDQHYPGIQGVGFSRRILPTEKAAHLRQIRSEGFPQYTIKPDGERSEYTSIIFLEPFDWRNQRAFGYDMFSEATRKEAMIRARDTGTTALSGKVILVQETDKDVQTGFLIYRAVYRKGEPLGTPEQRRKALMGYVYSPFRMNDFMQGIVAGNEAQVKLQIFDGDNPLEQTLLYHSGMVEKPHHSPEDRHFATHQSILECAGHRWLLDFVPSKYFEEQIETGLTTFILLLGITISLLLSAVVLSLTNSRGQAIALANTTADLEKANIELRKEITAHKRAVDELKNMARFPSENPNPVLRISKDGTLLYVNQAGFSLLPELHLQVGQAAPLKLQNAAHQAISNGSTQRLELEHGQRLFSFILGPVVAAGYVNLYADDITERKRSEEALRESEERYRELSIFDGLTQLYNSRHFYNQLKVEIDRADRYGQPLTLMLLDLDDFKQLNDTYGHIEGDQVLMRLGQVVKRCLRQTDTAYRYGGEEFTILLPMTTSKDCIVTAERIRTEFKREIFIPVPSQKVHVTVSIGVAQYKPQEDMKTFVNRVDQLMYQGKKNGKDRVCSESSHQEQFNWKSSL